MQGLGGRTLMDNCPKPRHSCRMENTALPPDDLGKLVALRHALHAAPELSGQERETADRVALFLRDTQPDHILRGLGGHGLAVVYEGAAPGPSVMFRAELDALPIAARGGFAHASRRPGRAHLCGHDGHMAILAGLGLWLARNRPARGRVILLFQPAEETGEGARAVLADPQFAQLRPDWAFALHNMPGLPLGALAVGPGPASCASVGVRLVYQGREAHASLPETGLSPAPALAALMADLAPYSTSPEMGPEYRLATLCHMRLGAPAFGIAPGQAEAWITLRTLSDSALAEFEADVAALAQTRAAALGLAVSLSRHDHFNATLNDAQAAAHIAQAGAALGLPKAEFALPMRASEDFGAFSACTRTGLCFLGAGVAQPDLHTPEYDFPDALIAPGVALFAAIWGQVLAGDRAG